MSRERSSLPEEVFLSHSSKNAAFAKRLRAVLKAHGVTSFLSEEHIKGAQEWHDEIGAALVKMLPVMADAHVVHQTACLRPVAGDGLLLLGRVPGFDSVYMATGAGRKGILLGPAMGTLGLITFIGSWNNFISPLIVLRSVEKYTIPLALRSMQDPQNTPWGAVMLGAGLAVLPLLILFIFSSRRLIAGLTAGALKG